MAYTSIETKAVGLWRTILLHRSKSVIGSIQAVANALTPPVDTSDMKTSIEAVAKAFTSVSTLGDKVLHGLETFTETVLHNGVGIENEVAATLLAKQKIVQEESDAKTNMIESIQANAKAFASSPPFPPPSPLPSSNSTTDITKSVKAIAEAFASPLPLSSSSNSTTDITKSVKAISKAFATTPPISTTDMTKSIEAVAKALSIPVPAPPPPIAVNTLDMAKSIKAVTKALTTPVVDTSSMVKSIQAVAKALATSISSTSTGRSGTSTSTGTLSTSTSSGTSTSSNYDILTDGFIIVDNNDDIPLKYVHLTKPIEVTGKTGIITDVYKKKGDTIRPKDPIMKIGTTIIEAKATESGVIESIAEKDATLASADTVYTYNPADNIEVSKYKYDGTKYEPDI